MLKFSSDQFDALNRLHGVNWIKAHRPKLVEEFGDICIAGLEPLEEVVQAAYAAGFDESLETFRFARVIAALSLLPDNDRRHIVVANTASSYLSREERLIRMERTALGAAAPLWATPPQIEDH